MSFMQVSTLRLQQQTQHRRQSTQQSKQQQTREVTQRYRIMFIVPKIPRALLSRLIKSLFKHEQVMMAENEFTDHPLDSFETALTCCFVFNTFVFISSFAVLSTIWKLWHLVEITVRPVSEEFRPRSGSEVAPEGLFSS
jgi:hypothetical protein